MLKIKPGNQVIRLFATLALLSVSYMAASIETHQLYWKGQAYALYGSPNTACRSLVPEGNTYDGFTEISTYQVRCMWSFTNDNGLTLS